MDWILEQWHWLSQREEIVALVGGLSLLTLFVSFIVVPMVIRRMPYDYFLEESEAAEFIREQHPVLRISFLILKNFLGVILVLGGLIMFLTPGQGILTLLIGLLLLNFPGKRRLEIRLIRIKPLKKGVDWIRTRAKKRPLALQD